MDKVIILVGTETGNAEDVAEDLAATLDELGVDNEVVDMEDAALDLLEGSRAVIVCTATRGDGELPHNSVDFSGRLEEERQDLGGVMFCVCGLGDNAYADFCDAGRLWSRFLKEVGAWEVVERYDIDSFPEEEDVVGACEWMERAAERFRELVGERG